MDSLTGKLISIATASKWDHISIVVPCGPHGKMYLMEATTVGKLYKGSVEIVMFFCKVFMHILLRKGLKEFLTLERDWD